MSPRGAKPKRYSPEMVERVRILYCEQEMTQVEVAAELGSPKVIWNLMRRHDLPRRDAIKRDQRGENNSSWKGDEATYSALHVRVIAERGSPVWCQECGLRNPNARYEWACVGNYRNVDDYRRLCVPCHRELDKRFRIRNSEGRFVKGGGPNARERAANRR